MTTLLERIQEINVANRVWMEEDPANRWAGMFTTDPAHWAEYGITTAEDFNQYLDACVIQNIRKGEVSDVETNSEGAYE